MTKRVPFDRLREALARVLVEEGFTEERARECALLFAEASRDGVPSHGLNRFPRFVRTVRSGLVDPSGRPEQVGGAAAFERWNGRRGPGNLNARASMDRAIELARRYGIGCVALSETNHWMRAGSYGWQAADAGLIGICWSNTLPNLPPWGASRPLLGNNPLVIAVPRPGGHVVLDMAMSQFSYGSLEGYARANEPLPVEGGFDARGDITRDPSAILESGRPLPIGYWKGSGLALLLDMVAASLSRGLSTHEIEADPERESRLSQVFLALDPGSGAGGAPAHHIAEAIVSDLHTEPGVRYPGERVLRDRAENLRSGVPVDGKIWRWVTGSREVRRDGTP